MARITLNQAVLSVALVVLLPVVGFGIAQSVASGNYARQLIAERLVASAFSTAATQREAFILAQSMMATEAVNPDVLAANARCSSSLARALLGQTAVLNLARVDAAGTVQCSAVPFAKPLSNAGEAWWRDGANRRDLTISAPGIGKIVKRNRMIAMLPVQRGDRFDGAITAAIDATWLENALRQSKLSEDAVVAIVDNEGNPLLSSGRRDLGRINLSASTGKVAHAATVDGIDWMYASAPLLGRKLHVVYTERQSLLMAPSRSQLRYDLMLPILAMVSTLLVVWFAINYFVVRWLRLLGKTATRFAHGDYSTDAAQFANAPAELAALESDLREMGDAISTRDAALKQSASQNLAMAREVNHRVKNNLQMVMSLIELQTAQISDSASRISLEQTRLRIAVIALIHRVLYEHGESSEYGTVDMDGLVPEICKQIRNANLPRIQLHCKSAIGILSVDQAIPISLFLVEAITNAYRHAFGEGASDRIDVALSGSADGGEIRITDNGTGFVVAGASETMGRQLMTAYAEQLNGTFTTDSDGSGTAVLLRFTARTGVRAITPTPS